MSKHRNNAKKQAGGESQLPSVADRLLDGLKDLKNTLEAGTPLNKKYSVDCVELDLEPREYTPHQIKIIRESLNISQTVFAELIGVSASTVKAWEQGQRNPSKMACRLFDEITSNPDHWKQMIQDGIKTEPHAAT
jgi:DNA-binding transcriptional regulator YiaG